ncbi:hypothetical protein HDU67_007367 [Dinochytrium kinnereticum]|nr:hypothetical protein HDU67_007367 [Dinochytrium kinnereticum]
MAIVTIWESLNRSNETLEHGPTSSLSVIRNGVKLFVKILWVQATIMMWSLAYMVPAASISFSLFEAIRALNAVNSPVFGNIDRASLGRWLLARLMANLMREVIICNLTLDIRSMFLFAVRLRGNAAFLLHLSMVTPLMVGIPSAALMAVSAYATQYSRLVTNLAVIVTVYAGVCVFQWVFCGGMALSDALKVKAGELKEPPPFHLTMFLLKNLALTVAIYVLIVIPIICIQFGTTLAWLIIFNCLLTFGQIYVLIVVNKVVVTDDNKRAVGILTFATFQFPMKVLRFMSSDDRHDRIFWVYTFIYVLVERIIPRLANAYLQKMQSHQGKPSKVSPSDTPDSEKGLSTSIRDVEESLTTKAQKLMGESNHGDCLDQDEQGQTVRPLFNTHAKSIGIDESNNSKNADQQNSDRKPPLTVLKNASFNSLPPIQHAETLSSEGFVATNPPEKMVGALAKGILSMAVDQVALSYSIGRNDLTFSSFISTISGSICMLMLPEDSRPASARNIVIVGSSVLAIEIALEVGFVSIEKLKGNLTLAFLIFLAPHFSCSSDAP